MAPPVAATFRRPLTEYFPAVSPRLQYPEWLQPLADDWAEVEAALRGERDPVFKCWSVPTQHGKSTFAEHALSKVVGQFPHLNHMYLSYAAQLALKKSRNIRGIYTRAGGQLSIEANAAWETPQGGGLVAAGVGGGIAGNPATGVVIIDDPHANRQQAESLLYRDRAWDWLTGDVYQRIHPQTSIIIIGSRWHPDDVIGRAIDPENKLGDNEQGYEYTRLPAINDAGEALWAEGMPLELLAKKRAASEYDWWSLYMQSPRRKGGQVFGTPTLCDLADVPTQGAVSIGIDLAYSKKTHADFSVAVVLRRHPNLKRIYVEHVVRKQVRAPEFKVDLLRLRDRYPGAPMTFHSGYGGEKGNSDWLKDSGVPLTEEHAGTDKLARAQPFAAAWNGVDDEYMSEPGYIFVPGDAPWSRAYLTELEAFTGVGDVRDDQVDASGSAFSRLPMFSGPRLKVGTPRRSSGLRKAF